MNLVNNSEIENSGHSDPSETTCLVKVRNLVILVNLKVAMIVKAALTGILLSIHGQCCNTFSLG